MSIDQATLDSEVLKFSKSFIAGNKLNKCRDAIVSEFAKPGMTFLEARMKLEFLSTGRTNRMRFDRLKLFRMDSQTSTKLC